MRKIPIISNDPNFPFTHRGGAGIDDYVILNNDKEMDPREICETLRDYHLSMEVLSNIVVLVFPDLEVPDPYMATLKKKADDAIKRWKERMK